MYYSTNLNSDFPGWLARTSDHCNWNGVECTNERVTSISLENLSLSGPFPTYLSDIAGLRSLSLSGNNLDASMGASSDICTMNDLSITGDENNCPNNVGTSGCCASVKLTSPHSDYLNGIVASRLGTSDCNNIIGSDSYVCTFMESRDNHDVFQIDPNDFPYDAWLEVSFYNKQVLFSGLKVATVLCSTLTIIRSIQT